MAEEKLLKPLSLEFIGATVIALINFALDQADIHIMLITWLSIVVCVCLVLDGVRRTEWALRVGRSSVKFISSVCVIVLIFASLSVWIQKRHSADIARNESPKSPENVKPAPAFVPLEVTPEKVMFEGEIPEHMPMTHTFRVANKSEEILYSVNFILRIKSSDLTGDDFEVHLSPGSRKPQGDLSSGAQHLADVQAFLAYDTTGLPVFCFYMNKLAGHDFREVTITRTRNGNATVAGQAGFFTTDPEPQSTKGDKVTTKFHPNEPLIGAVRPIYLVVNPDKDIETGKPVPGQILLNTAHDGRH